MKNFNQTNLERAKSEIIIKVANMLMEIDNETLDKVDTTCDSIKNTIKSYNKECDTCGFMGSYYLDGEKYKIGQCSICLMKSGVVDKIIID